MQKHTHTHTHIHIPVPYDKGVALQFYSILLVLCSVQHWRSTIYPVLWSLSLVKAKVKSQGWILVGQRSSKHRFFCTVYKPRSINSCVNVILQNLLEIGQESSCTIFSKSQRSRPTLAWPCTLTEDKDQSKANIGVPPLCMIVCNYTIHTHASVGAATHWLVAKLISFVSSVIINLEENNSADRATDLIDLWI